MLEREAIVPLTRRYAAHCRTVLAALAAPLLLAACDDAESKPSESHTYRAHLYHGKDVAERKYLGQVRGISQCKMTVHRRAAEMGLKPHTYSYVCCWVNEGDACYAEHK